MEQAAGIVTQGHRVASGRCGDPRFPHGTIAPQLPFFAQAIPGFERHLGGIPYPGTINLSFPGCVVRLNAPEFRLEGVAWTTHLPPENFFLSACEIAPEGLPPTPAFVYVPDPATKLEHFQAGSIVELLAPFIPGLRYGMPALLRYRPEALAIVREP